MKPIRLDKYLAACGLGSRATAKHLLKAGRVQIDGRQVKDPGLKVDPATCAVTIDGKLLHYQEFYYLMLNKPAGTVSATTDKIHTTVIDLLPEKYAHLDLFPVGRLDIDSEGLLLLTNDGKLAHRLLSPRHHVAKVYYCIVEGELTEDDVQQFQRGIKLKDFTTLPAELAILASGPVSRAHVTLYEGKFHQVKRMFTALGKELTYLQRVSFGPLTLDARLQPGQVRELTAPEVNSLKSLFKGD